MYRRYLYRNTFKSICIGIPIQFAESIGIGILSRWKEKYRETKVANFLASVSGGRRTFPPTAGFSLNQQPAGSEAATASEAIHDRMLLPFLSIVPALFCGYLSCQGKLNNTVTSICKPQKWSLTLMWLLKLPGDDMGELNKNVKTICQPHKWSLTH